MPPPVGVPTLRTPVRTVRPAHALGLTAVALLGLLAAATPVQADGPVTCSNHPKAIGATCATAFLVVGLTVGEATCILYTAPVNWLTQCGSFSVTIPLVAYAECYYNTAPANWASTCL
jgi:hypothetical protein